MKRAIRDIAQLLKVPKKVCWPEKRFQKVSENKAFVEEKFLVTDENNITIPELEVVFALKIGDSTVLLPNNKFGLFYVIAQKKIRLFQIEVYPIDRLSHRCQESGNHYYGPHIHKYNFHNGNIETYNCYYNIDADCLDPQNYQYWTKKFARHLNISFVEHNQSSLI